MSDRNKTELTQNITRQVALWLNGKGFKPVETEVGVAKAWVADVAGVCCPTQTELIGLRLIGRSPRWRSGGDQTLQQAALDAWRATMAAIPSPLTAAVEVKTSIGDFRGDRKWTAAEWPTNLCYVAMPANMIPREQWPDGWGVILFSKNGTTIRNVFPPRWRSMAAEQSLKVVLALAVRRDHATRYARVREFQKQVRITDGERKTVSRVADVVRLVRSVMNGKPVQEALRYHGIRASLPEHVVQDLASLCPKDAAISLVE
jgi:hypothetical protein